MADQDRKLVADFALTPMAQRGFPRPHEFSENLSEKLSPLPTFCGHCTTFTRLLFVVRTYIYRTVAKTRFCSHTGHRLQCRSVPPTSDRDKCSTIEKRQTRLLGIEWHTSNCKAEWSLQEKRFTRNRNVQFRHA